MEHPEHCTNPFCAITLGISTVLAIGLGFMGLSAGGGCGSLVLVFLLIVSTASIMQRHEWAFLAALCVAAGFAVGTELAGRVKWAGVDWMPIVFPAMFFVMLVVPLVAVAAITVAVAGFGPRDEEKAQSNAPAEPPTCLECGYDLRGNVSGRCPECGHGIRRPGSAFPLPELNDRNPIEMVYTICSRKPAKTQSRWRLRATNRDSAREKPADGNADASATGESPVNEHAGNRRLARPIVFISASVVAFALGHLASINDGSASVVLMCFVAAIAVAIVRGFRRSLLIALTVAAAGAVGVVAHVGPDVGVSIEMSPVVVVFVCIMLLLPVGIVGMLTALVVEFIPTQ